MENNQDLIYLSNADGSICYNENGMPVIINSDTGELYQIEMEEQKQLANNAPGPESKVKFTEDMTKLLIELFSEKKHQIRSGKYKKHVLHDEIAKEMLLHGYHVSSGDVSRKWRNLKITYTGIKDNQKKTGRGTINWPYFDQLDMYYADDVSINPASKLKPFSTLNTSKCEEESPSLLDSITKPRFKRSSKESLPPTSSSSSNELPEENLPRFKRSSNENLPSTSTSGSNEVPEENIYKKRRRNEPPWLETLVKIQLSQQKDIEDIKNNLKKSNEIQEKRNDLLKQLLEK